jgi:hypothetical protein
MNGESKFMGDIHDNFRLGYRILFLVGTGALRRPRPRRAQS